MSWLGISLCLYLSNSSLRISNRSFVSVNIGHGRESHHPPQGHHGLPLWLASPWTMPTRGSLTELRRRAWGRAWLSCCSWPRPLEGLAPFCPERCEEIGICPCKAHRSGRGRGSLPPLGKAGYPAPAGEHGDTEEPGTSPPTPQYRWNHVIWSISPTVSDRWSMCENPELHICPHWWWWWWWWLADGGEKKCKHILCWRNTRLNWDPVLLVQPWLSQWRRWWSRWNCSTTGHRLFWWMMMQCSVFWKAKQWGKSWT